MDDVKLLTVLVEIDEGTKTPYKAYHEILKAISNDKSLWIKEAKERQKHKRIRRIKFIIKVKLLRFKRL